MLRKGVFPKAAESDQAEKVVARPKVIERKKQVIVKKEIKEKQVRKPREKQQKRTTASSTFSMGPGAQPKKKQAQVGPTVQRRKMVVDSEDDVEEDEFELQENGDLPVALHQLDAEPGDSTLVKDEFMYFQLPPLEFNSGTLRVEDDGKMSMIINGIEFSVASIPTSRIQQQVVSIDRQDGKLVVLGNLFNRFVVSPELSALNELQ